MYTDPLHHPDPDRQAGFYDGVSLKRGVAWVIDMALVGVLALLISLFTIIGLFFIPLIFAVVDFFYRWMTIAGGSATLGMRVMAIELRNAEGRRLDPGQALLHTLGYYISFSVFLVQLASIVLMLTSERGQSVTDMVLGTVALNKRA